MSLAPSLQETLIAAFQSQSNNLYTAIPCIVVAVDLEKQMVDIQPSINQKMKDGTVKERPVVLGVPISFPTSKTAGFTFPINVGDTGLAVFSMRNMDAWKTGNGKPATPMNFAKFDKGDAIFIPGIQPTGLAVNNPTKHLWSHSPQDAVLYNGLSTINECEVRLKPDGNILIRTNKDISVECDNADILANTSATVTTPELNIDAIQTNWTGTVTHTGTFSFNGIIFSTHDHIPGPGPSNP